MHAVVEHPPLAACAGLPRVTMHAIFRALRSGLSPLRAAPPARLSQWAQEHFFLSAESSHVQGRWQSWAFQNGWMDAFSNDDIEEITVRKSKRVGYTKTLLAFVAYNAAHRRRKQAVWQPTDDDRDSFVKTELDPMLRDVKVMERVSDPGASGDTMKVKTFLGSVLHLLGAKAARSFRRITLAVAMLDEADGMDQQVEKSADPVTLANGRLEGAPFPTLIVGSTPRIKNMSHVEHRERQADAVMRYNITCPHCEVDHPLAFGGKDVAHGFKWTPGEHESVTHVCPHCHGHITQGDYLSIFSAGTWVDEQARFSYGQDGIWRDAVHQPCRAPRHVAFVIWAAYSPQRSWASIVREFLEAKAKAKEGDTGPLQGFTNETLGETWEIRTEGAEDHQLKRRPHTHQLGFVPPGCLLLAAGVDTQDDRLEMAVWGFGPGEEMWLIDYRVLFGDPALDETWTRLDDLLLTRYPQMGRDGSLPISGAAIDTGGHFTHAVYTFCRTREHRRVFAVRGSQFDGRPVKGKSKPQDVNWRGKILKLGVKLWEVGTDTAKDLLHARLKIDAPGPGCVHFPEGLSDEFYKGLTAEGRALQKTSSGTKWRWVKRRQRNEPLDCTVYAIFVSHVLGVHNMPAKSWQRLRDELEPAPDLFTTADPRAPRVPAVPPALLASPQPQPAPRSAGRQW